MVQVIERVDVGERVGRALGSGLGEGAEGAFRQRRILGGLDQLVNQIEGGEIKSPIQLDRALLGLTGTTERGMQTYQQLKPNLLASLQRQQDLSEFGGDRTQLQQPPSVDRQVSGADQQPGAQTPAPGTKVRPTTVTEDAPDFGSYISQGVRERANQPVMQPDQNRIARDIPLYGRDEAIRRENQRVELGNQDRQAAQQELQQQQARQQEAETEYAKRLQEEKLDVDRFPPGMANKLKADYIEATKRMSPRAASDKLAKKVKQVGDLYDAFSGSLGGIMLPDEALRKGRQAGRRLASMGFGREVLEMAADTTGPLIAARMYAPPNEKLLSGTLEVADDYKKLVNLRAKQLLTPTATRQGQIEAFEDVISRKQGELTNNLDKLITEEDNIWGVVDALASTGLGHDQAVEMLLANNEAGLINLAEQQIDDLTELSADKYKFTLGGLWRASKERQPVGSLDVYSQSANLVAPGFSPVLFKAR